MSKAITPRKSNRLELESDSDVPEESKAPKVAPQEKGKSLKAAASKPAITAKPKGKKAGMVKPIEEEKKTAKPK